MKVNKVEDFFRILFTRFFIVFGIIAAILFWNYCPPLFNKNQEIIRILNTEISRVDNDYQLKKNNLISSYNNIILNAKKSNKQINISNLQKDFNIISNDNDSNMFITDYNDACNNVLQKIKQRIIKNVLKVNNNILNNIRIDNKLEPVVDKNDNKILKQSKKRFVERGVNDSSIRLFLSVIILVIVAALILVIGSII